MSRYRILIIDDDESTHDVLAEYLVLAGYEVLHARDGREGLAAAQAQKPDLVLLDVMMPELDGFQVLEALRKEGAEQEAPILFLTSLDRSHLKVKGLELGAEDYIVKPFDKAELLARTKAALRRSGRYRKIEGLLSGSLADVSLAEILQTMEMGRKTARIVLHDMDGDIVLENGVFRAIRQGAFTGGDALHRLLFLERGFFTAHFGPSAVPAATEPLGIEALLIRATAYVDEIKPALAGLPGENPAVEIAGIPEDLPGLDRFRSEHPLFLKDLAAGLAGDLRDNVQRLVVAIRTGAVKIAAHRDEEKPA